MRSKLCVAKRSMERAMLLLVATILLLLFLVAVEPSFARGVEANLASEHGMRPDGGWTVHPRLYG